MDNESFPLEYGISPAYFISRFTNRFKAAQILQSLPEVALAGFTNWQPEVFHSDLLNDFIDNAAEMDTLSHKLNLKTRVFAAHYLLHHFTDKKSLEKSFDENELDLLISALSCFRNLSIISVPIPPYTDEKIPEMESEEGILFIEKISLLNRIFRKKGFVLSLEIMPDSLLSKMETLSAFLDRSDLKSIGFLFDSGHFNMITSDLPFLVKKLGSRINSTHLSDNDRQKNLSLGPGKGSICWKDFILSLRENTRISCLTIEIISPHNRVIEDYSSAKNYLENLSSSFTPALSCMQ